MNLKKLKTFKLLKIIRLLSKHLSQLNLPKLKFHRYHEKHKAPHVSFMQRHFITGFDIFNFVINTILIIGISITALYLSMHISMLGDESFSMSLVHRSYAHLIYLDSLDIHPPLYYIILKFVLQLFGVNGSIKSAIITARIFSFICIFLTFLTLMGILKAMNLDYNPTILYLLLITLSFWVQVTTSIRMYCLAALFIALEILNIVEYIKHRRVVYIAFLTLFAIVSEYTHDYAALIAGLFILIMFIYSLIHKNHDMYPDWIAWLVSGVVFGLSYLPWAYTAFTQVSNIDAHYWISYSTSLGDVISFISFVLLGTPLLRLTKKQLSFQDSEVIDLLFQVGVAMAIIISIVTIWQPSFITRYASPYMFSYIAIIYGTFATLSRNNKVSTFRSKSLKILLLAFLTLITASSVYYATQNQGYSHWQSENLERYFSTHKQPRAYSNKPMDFTYQEQTKYTGNDDHALCEYNTVAQYKHIKFPKSELHRLVHSSLRNGTIPKLIRKIWNTDN